jgi:hypothetical protein
MIRDPSDGSVRDEPVEFPDWDKKIKDKFPDGVPVVSTPLLDKLTSGLRQPKRTDAQQRLERSREWLKTYQEKRHARGTSSEQERSTHGDSGNDQGQAEPGLSEGNGTDVGAHRQG